MIHANALNRTTRSPRLYKHPNLTKQHLPWVLNVLLDLYQESYSFLTIQKSVVVGKGEVHHLHMLEKVYNEGQGRNSQV